MLDIIAYPNSIKSLTEADLIFITDCFQSLKLNHLIDQIKIPNNENQLTKTLWSGHLSDGESKRVVFIRTLLQLKKEKIKFLVLDEPFKGFGDDIQTKMSQLLKNLIAEENSLSQGCSVLLSEHRYHQNLHDFSISIQKRNKYISINKAKSKSE